MSGCLQQFSVYTNTYHTKLTDYLIQGPVWCLAVYNDFLCTCTLIIQNLLIIWYRVLCASGCLQRFSVYTNTYHTKLTDYLIQGPLCIWLFTTIFCVHVHLSYKTYWLSDTGSCVHLAVYNDFLCTCTLIIQNLLIIWYRVLCASGCLQRFSVYMYTYHTKLTDYLIQGPVWCLAVYQSLTKVPVTWWSFGLAPYKLLPVRIFFWWTDFFDNSIHSMNLLHASRKGTC